MSERPVAYRWDGEVMRPVTPYHLDLARELFEPGRTYDLAEFGSRSVNSHRHFFAVLRTAWENLSEADADRFPTPEHLRKWALTYTPFCSVRSYEASSAKEALRVAEFLEKDAQFARVEIEGKIVRHFVPASQAVAAMPANKIFMASKRAVLIVLAQKLGVDVDALEDAARTAA